jgi:hypothetical protein
MEKGDKTTPEDIDLCGINDLLASSKGGGRSVFDVDYWMPYKKRWKKKKSGPKATVDSSQVVVSGYAVKNKTQDSNGVPAAESSKTKKSRKKSTKRISDQELEIRMTDFNMEIDSAVHPEVSISGQTPLSQLMALEQADMIDFEWQSLNPSPTDFASISPDEFECIQLIVRRGDESLNSTFEGELVFQRDREITRGNKQQAKQYLASMALTRLLAQKDKNWFDLKFYELKNSLIPDYEIVSKPPMSDNELASRMKEFGQEPIDDIERSTTGQTASAYLGQLHQDKFITMEFNAVCPSHTDFAAVSPEDFECVQLVVREGNKMLAKPISGELLFERDRLIGRELKLVKQYLSSLALSQLLADQGQSWSKLSYKELKACLKAGGKVDAKAQTRK